MKLPVPFIQLPLLFDAGALRREIAAFDEGMWTAHPTGMPGNSALPLVTVGGDPARGDALDGPMRPTPALQRSPYLQQVLASLQLNSHFSAPTLAFQSRPLSPERRLLDRHHGGRAGRQRHTHTAQVEQFPVQQILTPARGAGRIGDG